MRRESDSTVAVGICLLAIAFWAIVVAVTVAVIFVG
jgi:hypothetical protein